MLWSSGSRQPACDAITAGILASRTEKWSAGEGDFRKDSDQQAKRYVYFWIDGVYCNIRAVDTRRYLLVIVGADEQTTTNPED
jgi:hypothetical protein